MGASQWREHGIKYGYLYDYFAYFLKQERKRTLALAIKWWPIGKNTNIFFKKFKKEILDKFNF